MKSLELRSPTPQTHGRVLPSGWGLHVHPSTSIAISPKAKERVRRAVTVVDDRPPKKGRDSGNENDPSGPVSSSRSDIIRTI